MNFSWSFSAKWITLFFVSQRNQHACSLFLLTLYSLHSIQVLKNLNLKFDSCQCYAKKFKTLIFYQMAYLLMYFTYFRTVFKLNECRKYDMTQHKKNSIRSHTIYTDLSPGLHLFHPHIHFSSHISSPLTNHGWTCTCHL